MPKNRKDVQEIIDAVEDHGWRVEPVKKGYNLYAPNGTDIVNIHKTPSARNWQRRAIRQIRHCDPNFRWKEH